MIGFIANIFRTVADAVYPPRCPVCDTFVNACDAPCGDCAQSLQRLEGDAFLPHLSKIRFSRCRSCFAYDGRIKDAIHRFKYGERMELARFFGAELAGEARTMGSFDVIVPVPLHRKRLRSRGFNQSALLARRVGKLLALPADLDSLRRAHDVLPQVGLERSQRIDNVKGAFVVGGRRAARLADKNVLLIDDVLTTGATVNECARVLIKAGAASVSVITLVRTL